MALINQYSCSRTMSAMLAVKTHGRDATVPRQSISNVTGRNQLRKYSPRHAARFFTARF